MSPNVQRVLTLREIWLRATPGAVRADAQRAYDRAAKQLTRGEHAALMEALDARRNR